MTSRPHDALFRSAFEHPAHAAGELQHVLPASLASAIDWSTLRLQPGSFVDPELADRHSDLLFRAQIGGEGAFVYVLLEHQSTVDQRMPLRMLVYMARIWERHARGSLLNPLPPIIPVLITHGGGTSAPRHMHELIRPHPSAVPGLSRCVPEFELFVDDLDRVSNAELHARALEAFPKLALWLLRDAREPRRLMRNLVQWAAAFRAVSLAPDGAQALHKLVRYVDLVLSERQSSAFYGKLVSLAPLTKGVVMHYGERRFEEGKAAGQAEGKAEGVLDGQRSVLAKLLHLKFGTLDAAASACIAAADANALDRWLERVLTADSLSAVFDA